MELGRRVPLGQSRDSTTHGIPVVFELNPAVRLALSLRTPLSIHYPRFPILGLGLSKGKQRYSVAEVGTPASPLSGSGIEQKYLGGAYSK